jgi:hypothetical protein
LAERYNNRIVEFLEEATSKPEVFQVIDPEYTAGTLAREIQIKLCGRERFKFTTNSRDDERIEVRMMVSNSNLDRLLKRRMSSLTRNHLT